MNRSFLTVVLAFVLIFSATVCFSKATEISAHASNNSSANHSFSAPSSSTPNGSEMENAVEAHLAS